MDSKQALKAFKKLAELGVPGSVSTVLVGIEVSRLDKAEPTHHAKLEALLALAMCYSGIRLKEEGALATAREVVEKARQLNVFYPPSDEVQHAINALPTPRKAPRVRTSKPKVVAPTAKSKPAVQPKAKPAPAAAPVGGRPLKFEWDDAWLCALKDTEANIYDEAKKLGVSRQSLHARINQAVARRDAEAQTQRLRTAQHLGPDHATELWLIEVWTPNGTVTLIKPFWTRAAADKFMKEQGHYYYKPPRIVRFVPAGD